MEILDYLYKQSPLILVLIAWAIRLETRIARIQTDLTWIKKELPKCRQTSDDPTR